MRLQQKAKQSSNWYIRNVALGRTPGRATLNVMADSQFSSFLQPIQDDVQNFVESNRVVDVIDVEVSTIEQDLGMLRTSFPFARPFLKLDTQGNDLAVVAGAGAALREFVGLQSELAIRKIYSDSPDYVEAIRYYESRGFELSALVPNNAGHFPRLIEIDCIMCRKDLIAGRAGAYVVRRQPNSVPK
jgi:FkbM family methyltransferase